MSFRNKLGIAFATIVAIMGSILLIVWWTLEAALSRQAVIASFSLEVYKSLHAIENQQHLFISTQRMQYAIVTSGLLEDLTARFNEASERFVREGITRGKAPVVGLDDYRDHFQKFSIATVELETAKSRLSLEGSRLLAASGDLSEYGQGNEQCFYYEVAKLLQEEKDYLLTLESQKAARVTLQAAELERLVSDAMENAAGNAKRLRLFRITKVASTYRNVFSDYLVKQQQFADHYERMNQGGEDLTEQLKSLLEEEKSASNREIAWLKNIAVLASLGALLVAIAAALVLAARITRPIAELTRSAEEISSGNLDTTVAISSSDEIGGLGRIFNQMTARLRDNFDEILHYRDHLEEQVVTRTEDLSREIAQRREVEQALRLNEERLRMIIEQAPLGIIVWDTTFCVVHWNPMAERIFGYSASEADGLSAARLLPEEVRVYLDKIWRKLLASPAGVRSSNRNLRRNGESINCDWFNTPIYDGAGGVVGALSLVQDATERIRTEEEGLKLKKLESTGVLAGGIAHDFNNILTAILGSINLALLDSQLSDKTRRLLSAAEKASLRAKDLTQQLLTFAKGGEPIRKSTSLAELIEDSATFVLSGSNVSSQFLVPDHLWPALIDSGQISQVIQNIVLNARHAMPGGGRVVISCTNVGAGSERSTMLDPETHYVRIAISDSGIGIPSHLLDKIFDPYFTTKQEGSGLGLAITLSIVNKHHGYILVNSIPGQGTEFIIYLPAADTADIRKQPTVFTTPAQALRVLVMDDEDMVRDILASMLHSLGHQVMTAADGREAVDLLQESQRQGKSIDLAIVDLTIPGGMGGLETLEHLRRVDPNLPVVVASGYSNDPVMASFRSFGFNGTVAKPFVLAQLAEAINSALGTSGG
jgi:PAS domain S-box-containing protein